MFLKKLNTGIAILIAFIGILLAGGGLAVSQHAGPDAEPPNTAEVVKAPATGEDEQDKDKPVAAAPRTVTVSRPVRREAAPYEDYAGRLEALRTVEVRPAVSGFVQQVCFKSGAEVKQGEVLFLLDPRAAQLALEKAMAELALAEAKKKRTAADLRRAGQLRAGNAVAREDVDEITERAAAAEAALKAAQIDAARARIELTSTEIRAPMSGWVGRPLVEAGTLVFRGQDRATLLTTVTSLDPIGLTFDMDERSFLRYQRLLRAQEVKGAGSSLRMQLADENGFPHEGSLASLEDHVSPQTGTVRVRGSLPNPGQVLLPGMFARVRMTFGKPRAVLEVPLEAILSDRGKHYVLVVGEGNIAQRRAVTVGQADNGLRIIEKGLRADEWVVIGGLGDVRAGDPVQPRPKATPKGSDPGRDRGR